MTVNCQLWPQVGIICLLYASKNERGLKRSHLKHLNKRPRPHKMHGVALDLIDQQKIAADMTLAAIGPLALQRRIKLFQPQRRVIGDQRQHRDFQQAHVVAGGAVRRSSASEMARSRRRGRDKPSQDRKGASSNTNAKGHVAKFIRQPELFAVAVARATTPPCRRRIFAAQPQPSRTPPGAPSFPRWRRRCSCPRKALRACLCACLCAWLCACPCACLRVCLRNCPRRRQNRLATHPPIC